MYFYVGLPRTSKGGDLIWVVMDRLAKSDHFISMQISYPLQKLAEIYISEIVKLDGISSSIILDRDLRFTSKFWEIFKEAL